MGFLDKPATKPRSQKRSYQ